MAIIIKAQTPEQEEAQGKTLPSSSWDSQGVTHY